MAYNPQLYGNPNQFGNSNLTYPMYNTNVNQPYFPQVTAPPLVLSAAYTKGEIGASSYPVAAGNTVVLLDSDTIDTDNPVIYIKTTSYDGKPQTIKKITGTVSYPNEQGLFTVPVVETVKEPSVDLSDYVKNEEIKEVKDNLDFVSTRLDDFEEMMQRMSDNLTNIDNRFNNMFNVFNNSNSSNGNCSNHDMNKKEEKDNNRNNYSNKKSDKKGSVE